MENKEDIKKLVERIKQPVKNIRQEGPLTLVELEDGTTLPLLGGIFELANYNVPTCNFCGKSGDEVYLFTPDDKNYICKDCTILALETFGSNGLTIDLNLSKIAPQLAEQLMGTKKDNS